MPKSNQPNLVTHQKKYIGKVTAQHGVNFFMESSAGKSDVFIPNDVVHECIKIGDIVTAIVESNEIGTCKWKAVAISTDVKPRHKSGKLT
jgi:hypothetical protein